MPSWPRSAPTSNGGKTTPPRGSRRKGRRRKPSSMRTSLRRRQSTAARVSRFRGSWLIVSAFHLRGNFIFGFFLCLEVNRRPLPGELFTLSFEAKMLFRDSELQRQRDERMRKHQEFEDHYDAVEKNRKNHLLNKSQSCILLTLTSLSLLLVSGFCKEFSLWKNLLVSGFSSFRSDIICETVRL